MEYNPFIKTAIIRKGISKPMKILKDKELLQGKILDFACGHGEDVSILSELGFAISGYDKFNNTYKNEESLSNKYDVVTCNYCFNVIPNLEEHRQVLGLLRCLSDNVYISVRSDIKAIRDTWSYNIDQLGYWTSNSSFQRFYDTNMVEKLFGEVKYISNNGSFKLFKLNNKN